MPAGDVDAEVDRDDLSLRKADAVLRSAAQGEVLRVAALQPLRFGLEDWLVEIEELGYIESSPTEAASS